MNKTIKLIFNILIAVAAVTFFIFLIDFGMSVKYANREKPDVAKERMGVFEYKLKHKAYGEITNSYFTDIMQSMEAPEGLEKTYLVADYANTAFLMRMYEEKDDEERVRDLREKLEALRGELEDYVSAADGIDEVLGKYGTK